MFGGVIAGTTGAVCAVAVAWLWFGLPLLHRAGESPFKDSQLERAVDAKK